MVSYTQNELNSIWQNLKDGIPAEALIEKDEKFEQTLQFSAITPYSDSNNAASYIYYTRRKPTEEASWGEWVRKN
jgi:hypothetical protein